MVIPVEAPSKEQIMGKPGGNARTYGMSDAANRQSPGEEGLRGEQGTEEEGRPDLVHEERLPDGRIVRVAESSGTAFAEVTGAAAPAEKDDQSIENP